MDWVAELNSRIDMQDAKYISMLFDASKQWSRETDCHALNEVKQPFGALLKLHHAVHAEKAYGLIEQLVNGTVKHLGKEHWATCISKAIFYGVFQLRQLAGTRRISRLLYISHKALLHDSNSTFFYITNMLLETYRETGELELAEDVFRNTSPPVNKTREYFTFYFYKGVFALYSELFEEANMLFKTAFAYRRGQKAIAPFYFVSSLLTNRFPKQKYLQAFDCMYLLELACTIKKGEYSSICSNVEMVFANIKDYTVYRVLMVHAPFVCLASLMHQTYLNHGSDNKLKIQRIANAIGDSDLKETICLISSLISLGRVKGYISIAKMVVVFSRIDPFPCSIH
ncbi:hypothetical protein HK407_01g00700 [Ordospora pajunii]|uniref:uncharacterized protein n=1 Tax=Ordospora pajunii TaxID=3039483 RepID=UPI0029527B2D|nr:uncharacterized protein HK407_01g00700 [Ordospora pajunii]KAH9412177.1 hypothetical protein HK407_01g00700 [Ordospora pajunii]